MLCISLQYGADIAGEATYQMASVTTKVIPWWNKLSFAYATLDAIDAQLEHLDQKIWCEDGESVSLFGDQELTLSYLFRNVWIRPLPHQQLVFKLKKHENHLQTCGLLYSHAQKEALAKNIYVSGVVRMTNADMSRMIPNEAHDGGYPLREYSRMVEIDEMIEEDSR